MFYSAVSRLFAQDQDHRRTKCTYNPTYTRNEMNYVRIALLGVLIIRLVDTEMDCQTLREVGPFLLEQFFCK